MIIRCHEGKQQRQEEEHKKNIGQYIYVCKNVKHKRFHRIYRCSNQCFSHASTFIREQRLEYCLIVRLTLNGYLCYYTWSASPTNSDLLHFGEFSRLALIHGRYCKYQLLYYYQLLIGERFFVCEKCIGLCLA